MVGGGGPKKRKAAVISPQHKLHNASQKRASPLCNVLESLEEEETVYVETLNHPGKVSENVSTDPNNIVVNSEAPALAT